MVQEVPNFEVHQGLNRAQSIGILSMYRQTGEGLDFDSKILQEEQTVRPLVRGVQTETRVVVDALLAQDPILRWAQEDAIGFTKSTKADKDVRSALLTLDDLIENAASGFELPEERTLNTLAVAEKTVEVATLAAPYIPTETKREIEEQIKKEKEGKTKPQKNKKFKRQQPQERSENEHPKLNLEDSRLSKFLARFSGLKIRFPHLDINLDELGDKNGNGNGNGKDDSKKEPEKKRKGIKTNWGAEYSHPLLHRKYIAGRERSLKITGDSQEMLRVSKELLKWPGCDFVATKFMNYYNPSTGEMAVVAPTANYKIIEERQKGEMVTPLGYIPKNLNAIGIPIPVKGESDFRNDVHSMRLPLGSVSLTTEANGILLTSEELAPYVVKDSLGNISIDLSTMPQELKELISSRKIVMHTEYFDSFSTNIPDAAPLIGAMPEEERYRLNLYPPEVKAFVLTLMDKHKRKVDGFDSKAEIFARLAQFIGDFWLTYDLGDAQFELTDPVGFGQTERVLRGNVSSCEGANVALGQLMRYFLEEHEGIAYVEGFSMSRGSDNATASNLHLKVMYRNTNGREMFFDATPWAEEEQRFFNGQSEKRKRAMSEWLEITKDLRTPEVAKVRRELPEVARLAMVDFDFAWSYKDIDAEAENEWEEEGLNRHTLWGYLRNSAWQYIIHRHEEIPDGYTRRFLAKHPRTRKIQADHLMKFLLDYHGISEEFERLWTAPEEPIDGVTDLNVRFLERSFYSGYLPFDPTRYTDYRGGNPLVKDRFLDDHDLRGQLFSQMAQVAREGMEASVQNIEAVSHLARRVEGLWDEYMQKFADIFEPVRDRLGMEPIEFVQSAPFLMLLENPITYLNGFFRRSTQKDTLGYLLPNEGKTIDELFDSSIYYWRQMAERDLERFEGMVKKIKRTRAREEVVVPSTLLWERFKSKNPPEPIEKGKKHLDPIVALKHLRDNN